jgi:hypothetical protein
MGMYTEISFAAELDSQTPECIKEAIRSLVAGDVPDYPHPFFQTPRSLCVMLGESTSFPAHQPPVFEVDEHGSLVLYFRANLKKQDDEIELFLDWIKPYILYGSGARDLYAVVIHEDADTPDLYYVHEY